MVGALLGLLPPLLFRWIIDDAIPSGDRSLVGVADRGHGGGGAARRRWSASLQRWGASSIGEGMIHDLRVALFDKVQRMPVAFFTRTQTGALISRLNNDVIGAQDAVTGTLGSIVSNVIVLATTLTTMLILEWRLTLLALVVLPLFILPAKRVGRVLQAISRERMDLNAADEHADDRAVQRLGRHARQALRPLRRRADRVRPTGRRGSATPASARRCTAGCSSSPSAS